jgi:hypothetical protein
MIMTLSSRNADAAAARLDENVMIIAAQRR